ncbi:MAG: hypothetical protein FJ291_12940 [Planctomycetes bacterium]|nr:hypothetical protein [Planctomycetota bacterium]
MSGPDARAPNGPEAAPPPLVPPPMLAQAPSPRAPRRLSAQQQKLTLYAGAALVVLIVIVLLFTSPQRQPLELVPRGQTLIQVQVVDVRRFIESPVYQALAAAGPQVLAAFFDAERKLDLSLKTDVATVVRTDDSTILVGRFRPGQLRDSFEEKLDLLSAARKPPGKLELHEEQVGRYTYFYCQQEGVNVAFATVGSGLACYGDRWGVRRFLKGRAGYRGNALDDDLLAAAHSPALARRAFLYRLEKPDGLFVGSKLKEVLGQAGEGVSAAFFALATAGRNVELAIRLVARDAKAAERLELQLLKASTQVALRRVLGADAPPRVALANKIVTLESTVPIDELDEIIERDKKGEGPNLILALISS